MVVPNFVLVPFLLAMLNPLSSPANANSSLARPGCHPSCGSVVIPYPFGMGGVDCFLDEWYEIDCRNGSSYNISTPFLKKIDLEVINISLPQIHYMVDYNYTLPVYFISGYSDGTIQARIRVLSSPGCSGQADNIVPRLDGSQFVFSQSRNKFAAVGCNVTALVDTNTSEVVGCKSGCSGESFSHGGSCPADSNCCQITLPFYLEDFKVEFNGSAGEECAYAFLADQSWITSNNSELYSSSLGNQSVPVVLEWGISNDSNLYSQLKNQTHHKLYCGMYSLASGSVIPFAQCTCLAGYEGNGYLDCSDRDECVEAPPCPINRKCVNRVGHYECIDSWKRVKYALIGIGSTLGALLLLLIAWRLRKYIKKRNEIKLRKKYFTRNGGLLLQQQLNSPEGSFEGSRMFTSKDLTVATDNFSQSRVLGQGGQGTVYKGMLADGRIVAIKKSMVVDEEKLEQFINEVVILSQINHRNIVKLLGCCLETEVPLLVYEFIPNGTLFEYLHDPNEGLPVTWETRLRIGTELSGALSYLHSAASIPIYHRDIKSTNILLDEKYRAKVADFGTSKSVSLEQTHVTTLVQGTFGYLDPEYFQTSQFTDKSDVYSFGVVLVELLTGQKPISSARAEEGRSLVTYFIICMEENQLFDILDPQVKQKGTEQEISRVAHLAKRCLHLHGRNRPTMKEVAAELEEVRNIQFPSGILKDQDKNVITEDPAAYLAPGGPSPETMTFTSQDELPLLVTTSWGMEA